MTRTFLKWLAVPFGSSVLLLALGSCMSTDPGPAFAGVEGDVAARSGGRQRVRWSRSENDDMENQRAVSALLGRGPLTAQAAAQVALLNNRGLQAEFEEIGIAHADFVQAGLLSNPSFSASWRFPNKPPLGTDAEYALAGNVLELFLLPARRKVAARELERARLRVAAAALGLIAETKTAVYTLQARQQLFRRLRLIVATNDAAADLARRQHQAGNIPDVELANQQALAAQARVDVLQTQAQLRSDRERLNRLMGLSGEVAWQVSDHLPPHELSAKNLETLALAQHLDLEMARRNVVAVGSALALRTNTRYLPTAIRVGVSTEREPDRQRVTGPTLDLELPTGAFKGGSLREHIRAPFSNCCFRHP